MLIAEIERVIFQNPLISIGVLFFFAACIVFFLAKFTSNLDTVTITYSFLGILGFGALMILLGIVGVGKYQTPTDLEICLQDSECRAVTQLGSSRLIDGKMELESTPFRQFKVTDCSEAEGMPATYKSSRQTSVFLIRGEINQYSVLSCERDGSDNCHRKAEIAANNWIRVQSCLDAYNQLKEETHWFGILSK